MRSRPDRLAARKAMPASRRTSRGLSPVGVAPSHPDAGGDGQPAVRPPRRATGGQPRDGSPPPPRPRRAHALEQKRELVGAGPGQGLVRPHAAPKAVGHQPQQLVAGAEAQRFVDPPETVEAHDQGREALGANALGLGRPGLVEQRLPVGQARDHVEPGASRPGPGAAPPRWRGAPRSRGTRSQLQLLFQEASLVATPLASGSLRTQGVYEGGRFADIGRGQARA